MNNPPVPRNEMEQVVFTLRSHRDRLTKELDALDGAISVLEEGFDIDPEEPVAKLPRILQREGEQQKGENE